MMYAARRAGWPGYIAACVDNPEHKKYTARDIASWVQEGYDVERVDDEKAIAGLREYIAERKRREG